MVHRYAESKVYIVTGFTMRFMTVTVTLCPKHVPTWQFLTIGIKNIFIQFLSCLSCGTKMEIKNISVQ